MSTLKEISWEDEVSEDNPVLCWISNKAKGENMIARNIVYIGKEDGCYYTEKWYAFKYATPVLPTECRSIDKVTALRRLLAFFNIK